VPITMIRCQALIVLALMLHTIQCESNDQWNHSDLPREISDEDETVGVAESMSNHKWFQKDSANNASLYLGEAFERLTSINSSESKSEWSKSSDKKPANSTSGRSGRELDLDALLTGSVKQHEVGERESRILNDPPSGMAIQGFIPVLGLGAVAAAGAASLASSSNAHSLVQQSFQKHASHVPYGYPYPKQTGSAISHRLQALASSFSPINKLNRRRYQAPSPAPSSASLQSLDYGQFAQQCTCVPFYMCKAGYIEQERSNSAPPNQYGPIMRMHQAESSQMPPQSSLQSSQLAALMAQAEQQYQMQQQQQQQQQNHHSNHFNHQQRAPTSAASESLQSMYANPNSESSAGSNPDLELPIDERSVDGRDKTQFDAESMLNQTDFEMLGRMLGFGNNHNHGSPNKPASQCGMLRTCCPLLSTAELMAAQQYSSSSVSMMNHFAPTHSSGNNFGQANAAIVNSFAGPNPPSHAYSPPPQMPSLPSPYGFPTQPAEFYGHSKPTMSSSNGPQSLHAQNHHSSWKDTSFLSNRQRASFSHQPDHSVASAVNTNRWQTNQQQCGVRPDVGNNQARVLNQGNVAAGATEFGEFPWQAALLKRLGPADSLFVCGATLIGQDWIATAAHCIKK
jgi:hypothetical protein